MTPRAPLPSLLDEADAARILVVDDRPGNRLALVEILGADDCVVVTAASGDEALRVLMDQDFSVVLLDVNMPGMDGFEVARMIRRRRRSASTPIIFVTAISIEDDSVRRGYLLGAVDYIFIPIVPEILRAKVGVFVELHNKTKRLEASLRERAASEARYRALFHDSPIPLWEIDLSGVRSLIDRLPGDQAASLREYFLGHEEELLEAARTVRLLEVNTANAEMCEAATEAQLSDALTHVMGDKALDAFRDQIVALAGGRTGTGAEATIHTAAGHTKHVSLRTRVLPGHEKTWARVVVSSTDIAELHERRAQLERINKELRQFAYVASHDLRGPLRAIDSLSNWLEKGLSSVLDEEQRSQMALLRGRVKRMDRLLTDLLEYARAGGEEVDLKPVDVAALVVEVGELLGRTAEYPIDTIPPAPSFETAEVSLRQVFLNIIGNAIKHHDRPSGRITVTTRDEGRHYRFAVSDDGPGIPPKFHDRVFGMFQTLKPRDEVEGSGMGLALVRKVVERAGGEVRVISPGERGTTVVFTWPKVWKDGEEQEGLRA